MKKEVCGNCAHLGQGLHQVKGRKTLTFECQSFEGSKKERRVKLTNFCDHYFQESTLHYKDENSDK